MPKKNKVNKGALAAWLITIPVALAATVYLVNFTSAATIDRLISEAEEAREQQDTETAFELLDRASALETFAWQRKPEVAFALGKSFESADDFPQAAKKYSLSAQLLESKRSFNNKDPFYDSALQNASFAYFNSANYHQAISYTEQRQLAHDDNDLVLLGKSHLRLNLPSQAAPYFKEALQLNPSNQEASYYHALTLLEDDLEEAGQILKEHNYNLEFAEYAEAIITSSEKITDSSSTIYRNIILADLFLRINEPERAQYYAEATLLEDPEYRDGWIVKAEAMLEQNELIDAEECALLAVEQDPTFEPTFSLLARIKTAQQNLAAAKEYQEQAKLLK